MATTAKIRALWRLGTANLLRVAVYRALLKAGYYSWRLPIAEPLVGPFLSWPAVGTKPSVPANVDRDAWARLAQRVAGGNLPVFSTGWVETGFPPRWHRSVISGIEHNTPQVHWSTLPDFGLAGGDVKGYWETGRFDGLLILSLGWLCTGREDLRTAIDTWLTSWCADNPANAGLQWKCGQETGIRLMQLLLAVCLLERLGAVAPSDTLCALVRQHAERIEPTMLYALGQDNNHGTSEAAALFAAGAFLRLHGGRAVVADAERWLALGYHWLDNRIGRLVACDGSFSQHSVNYHRLMLDTCSFAETLRRWYGLPPFTGQLLEGCKAATRWLAAMTDPRSGNAPNLGANDGARLFVLHRQQYRDFRPSVQWAAALFLQGKVYKEGQYDEQLAWLGIEASLPVNEALKPASRAFPDGGYTTLAAEDCSWALLRNPRYRFRPSHADALHFDLWVGGFNVLGDAGSFAYSSDQKWMTYFTGTGSHNTVQFDDRDQMPRVSRFLFGDWLDAEQIDFDFSAGICGAAYRDGYGAYHRRTVHLETGRCVVVDEISGFSKTAVLRWRLENAVEGIHSDAYNFKNEKVNVKVSSSPPINSFTLAQGWKSDHYLERTSITVIEIEILQPSVLTSEITWNA